MKKFLLGGLYLVFSLWLRADIGMYESVEWMTARSDRIGIYMAAEIQGPIKLAGNPGQWGYPYSTAEFKLVTSLRGSPPEVFSKTRSLSDPAQLGFKQGDAYIFFFAAGEHPPAGPTQQDSDSDNPFTGWDYVWLQRPVGRENGVAIDHHGRILSDPVDSIKVVIASLSLAPAHPDIVDRYAYFYSDDKARYPRAKDFDYRIMEFPTNQTADAEPWADYLSFGTKELVVHRDQYDARDDPFSHNATTATASPATEAGDKNVYSDEFASSYPTNGTRDFDLGKFAEEPPVEAWNNPAHERKVTVRRTDGTKYDYANQKAVIRIEGKGLVQPQELSMKGFRTVTATWLSDQLIAIEAGLSRIARVEAVYEVEKQVWICRESVQSVPVQKPGG